jgi:hypothetical protein
MPTYALCWVGAEPLAKLLERHPGVRVGSWLYAAPQPAGWQPIETAPTDGTQFLGYRDGHIADAYRIQRDDCEDWCFGGKSGAVEFFPWLKPTHWMPRPSIPGAAPAAQPEAPAEPSSLVRATRVANSKLVDDYLHDYEMDDGEHCLYQPNEAEALLIADAVHGLLADDEFVSTFNAWQDAVRALATPAPAAQQPAQQPAELTDEEVNRLLEAEVPGGTKVRDWLPQGLPGGLGTAKAVVRAILKAQGGSNV